MIDIDSMKRLADDAGMNQKELARASRVNVKTIQRWATGTSPTLKKLEAIRDAINEGLVGMKIDLLALTKEG